MRRLFKRRQGDSVTAETKLERLLAYQQRRRAWVAKQLAKNVKSDRWDSIVAREYLANQAWNDAAQITQLRAVGKGEAK